MLTVWKTLVQPKLDYCSQLWSPPDQESINKIELVQKHFVDKIPGMGEMNYWEKLVNLRLLPREEEGEIYGYLSVED